MSLIGKSTLNNSIVSYSPGLIDYNWKRSTNPNTGTCGSSHTCDIQFSATDNAVVEDYMLEFDIVSNDATNTLAIQNVFLLLAEIKYLIRNVEITYHKTTEEIYCAVMENLKKVRNDQVFGLLQTLRTNLSANYTADVVSTTVQSYQIPLSLIFPELEKHTTNHNINDISFHFRFQPNYGTVVLNNRFCASATTTNAWDITKISISNIAIRPVMNRFFMSVPRSVSNPVFLLNKYDVKSYVQSWNTVGTDNLKIVLSDFPRRKKVMSLGVRIYPESLQTAYNDADAMQCYSNSKYIGMIVRYQGRVLVDMSTAATRRQRINYIRESYFRKYGFFPPSNLENESDNYSKFWQDHFYVDLSNHESYDADVECIGGIVNEKNDMEIELHCTTAIGTSCRVVVYTHYLEAMTIGKNGLPVISN